MLIKPYPHPARAVRAGGARPAAGVVMTAEVAHYAATSQYPLKSGTRGAFGMLIDARQSKRSRSVGGGVGMLQGMVDAVAMCYV